MRVLPVATLLIAVGLSGANGFINGVVVYERDTTVFYYPLFEWAIQQLRAGQFPLWCPLIFGGYPLLADSELGLTSPIVLLSLLTLPPDMAFVILRLAFTSIAAIGGYALARAWQMPHAAATMAGISFALGSFVQAHMPHENIIRTAAWLPVTLACVERAVRSVGLARRRWIVAGGVSVGAAGVGLHPEVLLVNLLTLGVYGLLRCTTLGRGAEPRHWRSRAFSIGMVVAIVACTGLGLGAVQLIPLGELAPLSARAGSFQYSEVAGQSFTPLSLIELVFPYVFRGPDHQQWGLWTHWESYLYVGLAPLVLALVALTRVRRPEVAIWTVLGSIGVIVALGQYSPLDIFAWLWHTPGLGWVRAPGRFELVGDLSLAMLAAQGLAILQERAQRARGGAAIGQAAKCWLGILGALLMPFLMALLLDQAHTALLAGHDSSLRLVNSFYLSLPRDIVPLSDEVVYRGLLWSTDLTNPRVAGALVGLFLSVATITLWQTAPWPRLRCWGGWQVGLLLTTIIDLLAFGWSIHPRQALSVLAQPDPAVATVHQIMLSAGANSGPERVLGSPVVIEVAPDRLVPLGIQDAGGYSSLDTVRQRAFLQRVQRVDDALLDLWNVHYVLDPAMNGPLNEYQGVQYFPRNPLLDATVGGDLSDQWFRVPSSVVPAEIRVISALVGGRDLEQNTEVAEVTLRAGSGDVIGQYRLRAGVDTMDWAWDDAEGSGGVRHSRVEAAGPVADRLPDGQVASRLLSFARIPLPVTSGAAHTVELRSLAPRGRLVVYGVAVVDRDGNTQQLFGRNKSKYRQVANDQAVRVLENTAAYPRVFLASRARIAPPNKSLEEMDSKPFSPREEVILASETPPTSLNPAGIDAAGARWRDLRGSARIDRYTPSDVEVHIDTPVPAFLVLTDTFYPGWHAYLDGRDSRILRGDLTFRVVEVPAGAHEVVFRFAPASVLAGLAVSLVVLAVLVCVWMGKIPGVAPLNELRVTRCAFRVRFRRLS